MNRFIVSARKYRPSLFGEVRSQPQVTITLRNQLKEKRVPQVVLFCGPRGSGKTSCARIFAKAINCEALQESGEPCNACMSCTQFQTQTSMNIYELDAASHNSVEDARQLLEQVRYHPTSGKKVFIIDEVHMLSKAAFDTLLKNFEEPPSHVVFILATTERDKLPATFKDRCQMFDFLSISATDILAQLQHIAREEGIETDEEALHLISHRSEGSFREALHAFDKMVSFEGGKKLTKKAVLIHLHILDHSHYFDLTEKIKQGNVAASLKAYDHILRLGFESLHFINGLSRHFRNLLVAKTTSSSELLHTAPTINAQYTAQAKNIDLDFLCRSLEVTEQCELHYRERQDKRLHIELALIKLSRFHKATPMRSERELIPSQPVKAAPLTKSTTSQVSSPTSPTPLVQVKKSVEKSIPSPKPVARPLSTQGEKQDSTSLSLDSVKSAWKVYMEKLKEKGAMPAYATMKSPLSLEDNTIVLEIPNALQKNTLNAHAQDLLAFMRRTLQNPTLRIEARVTSLQKEKKKMTTVAEKMEHLTQKYPLVKDLKTGLDLG